MLRKRFYVKIKLELHAITCPGVWLCKDGGYLEATIKTLGYFFRTGAMESRFPLLCHDHYTMEGYFKTMSSMAELESVLAAEQVETTLWQNGRRMAHFMGKLSDVMQSSLPKFCCEHNVNVQLLMKPSPAFTGIIAPKVELTAQVNVKDRLTGNTHKLDSIFGDTQKCSNSFPASNFSAISAQRFHDNCKQSVTNSVDSHLNCLANKRRQQPVCHARDLNNALRPHAACLPCSKQVNTQKSEQRRLSACSSLLSNISYPFSQVTAVSSSKCSHLYDSNGLAPADEHQQRCTICQTYQKIFQVPTKFYQYKNV